MTDFAWAIVGSGRVAHRFAEAVFRLPGTHLRGVLGHRTAAAAQFVAHWSRAGKPSPRAVQDLAALLADETIDAVYIATPHSAHAPFIRACWRPANRYCAKSRWCRLSPWRERWWRLLRSGTCS